MLLNLLLLGLAGAQLPFPGDLVSYPDQVVRPSYQVTEQQAFVLPEAGGGLGVQSSPVVYPDSVARPAYLAAEQGAFVLPPLPERTAPLANENHDADRPQGVFFQATQQQSFVLPPLPIPNAVIVLGWQSVTFPDWIARPATLGVHEQQAFASNVAPERTAPLFPEVHIDRVDRPTLHASQQLAVTEEIPFPEGEIALDWSPSFPEQTRRSTLNVSEQQAFAANLLPIQNTVIVLGWITAEFPDWIARAPALGAHQQQAFSENVAPERNAPLFSEQHADRVDRPTFGAHQQLAFVDTPLRPEGTVALDWEPSFPERVLRPTFPTPEQLVTAASQVPERTTPLAVPSVYPDRVDRPAFHASQQLAVSEEIPRPEGIIALDWEPSFPERATRATLHASEQSFYAANIVPILNPAIVLGWITVDYPDWLERPRGLAAHEQQAVTELSPVPLPNPVILNWFEVYPDAVYRPSFSPTEQLAFALPVKPEGKIALDWEPSFPERALRSSLHASEHQAFATSPKPERTAPIASEQHATDRIDRPFFHASQQLAFVDTPLRPEGTVALDWEPSFPERVLRSAIHASEHPSTALWSFPLPSVTIGWEPSFPERTQRQVPVAVGQFAFVELVTSFFQAYFPDFITRAVYPYAGFSVYQLPLPPYVFKFPPGTVRSDLRREAEAIEADPNRSAASDYLADETRGAAASKGDTVAQEQKEQSTAVPGGIIGSTGAPGGRYGSKT